MIRILCFTDSGMLMGEKIKEKMASSQNDVSCERCPVGNGQLREWTEKAFEGSRALIFVGAAGIAVRAIAPFVCKKDRDPAVLVVDDTGAFVIPILSGHLGGANLLAKQLADDLGATPVITTSTDRNGVFAVDTWAKEQGLTITDLSGIKVISAALLSGKSVTVTSDFPISGKCPEGVIEYGAQNMDEEAAGGSREDDEAENEEDNKDENKEENKGAASILITDRTGRDASLLLVPKSLVLGIGCKAGTAEETIRERVTAVLSAYRLSPIAIERICSIDVKKEEPGLLAFAEKQQVPFVTFSARELSEIKGEFTASEFTKQTVGVDNVCERSAYLGAFPDQEVLPRKALIVRKDAGDGVTVAVARKEIALSWPIKDRV